MLAAKRIESVYFNESVALDLAKKLYPKIKLAVHSQYPAFEYAYHMSSIKHPELVTRFNQFLISHAEQVAEIRRHYGLK
jgi:ABC-type thiamine transport system substrate-binding protein